MNGYDRAVNFLFLSPGTLTANKTAIELAISLLIILAEASTVAEHGRGSSCRYK